MSFVWLTKSPLLQVKKKNNVKQDYTAHATDFNSKSAVSR